MQRVVWICKTCRPLAPLRMAIRQIRTGRSLKQVPPLRSLRSASVGMTKLWGLRGQQPLSRKEREKSGAPGLWMRFMAIALTEILSVVIAVGVQPIHH